MCFVRSWKVGLLAMAMAARLSQKTAAGAGNRICKSLRRLEIQINSLDTAARARYSASADERDTVACFLDFQLTREAPRNTQKLVMERRVSGQEPQSESTKALRLKSLEDGRSIPCPAVAFK